MDRTSASVEKARIDDGAREPTIEPSRDASLEERADVRPPVSRVLTAAQVTQNGYSSGPSVRPRAPFNAREDEGHVHAGAGTPVREV
jgi:hypothetical protein